jgi:hypothetical protein
MVNDLKIIVEKIKNNNKIYLRTLKPKVNNYSVFEYVDMERLDLNIDVKLLDLVN